MAAAAKAVFEADSSKLDSTLAKVQSKFVQFRKAMAETYLAFQGIGMIVHAVADQFEKLHQSFELGKQMNELSLRTGVAIGDLVPLVEMFKNVGKSAEDVGPVINKMQKTIATGAASAAIRRMGLDFEAVKKATPAEQFAAIGRAINGIQNPMERANAAMEVFGRSGAELLPMFAEKGFGDMSREMTNKAQILQRDAALFTEITNDLRIVGEKMQGFFLGVADRVGPVILPLLEFFKGADLTKWGQAIGDAIALGVQTLTDGSLLDILILTLMKAFAYGGNYAIAIFRAAATALGEMLVIAFRTCVEIAAVLTKPAFWAGLGQSLLEAAQSFIAMMLEGVAKVLGALRHVPGIGGKAGKAADALNRDADSWRGAAEDNRLRSRGNLGLSWESFAGRMHEEIAKSVANVGKQWDSGAKTFDTNAISKRLDDELFGLLERTRKVSEKSLEENPTKTPNGGDMTHEASRFAHLTSIGGGSWGHGGGSPQQEQKRTNSLLQAHSNLLREIRDRTGGGQSKHALTFS